MSNSTHDSQVSLSPRLPIPPAQNIAIFTTYALLTLILTHPLIFNLTRAVPNDIGDPLLNTWILAWDTHALLTDPLNLFNANIFHPLPNTLAYSEHLISTALLAAPLQLITGEPVVAYNLSLLLAFPLAAWGMYLLTFHWTKQRGAAFVAGLIFGFAPYRFAAIAHLQLLTFQWLPLALLFLDKILGGQEAGDRRQGAGPGARHYVALGIFLLLQILASWYLAIYSGLIFGLYFVAYIIAARFPTKKTHSTQNSFNAALAKLTLTLLLVLLCALPFALPYLPLLDELRAARPLSMALSLAAAPTDYAAAAPFNRIFGPLTETFRTRPGFTEENTLFAGIVAPLLALLAGFFVFIKRALKPQPSSSPGRMHSSAGALEQGGISLLPASREAFILLVIALALTFPGPYEMVARLIPPATIVRVPPRWIIPALFALAALSAFALAALSKNFPKTKKAALIISTALLLLEAVSVPIPLAQVDNRNSLNPAYHWLAQQPNPTKLALVELPMHSAPAPEFPEVKRLYAGTLGWWRLVNGYSGYTPPRQPKLADALSGFPDEQSVATLQQMSIDNCQLLIANCHFLLVHPGESPFERSQWEDVDRWRAERNPALRPVGQFNGDYLYQILPADLDRIPSSPQATFGVKQEIRLLDATIENSRLTIYWQPAANISTDYTVFIHLRAPDGFVRSQADGPPVSGHYATSQWQPGEVVQDIHPLPAGEDFTQVDHLAIGLYHPATGHRLPAFGPDGTPLPDDTLILPLQK